MSFLKRNINFISFPDFKKTNLDPKNFKDFYVEIDENIYKINEVKL